METEGRNAVGKGTLREFERRANHRMRIVLRHPIPSRWALGTRTYYILFVGWREEAKCGRHRELRKKGTRGRKRKRAEVISN